MKKFSLYWLVVIAVASALWLPNLLAIGMFTDGIYNSICSIRLAAGASTFWAPLAMPDKPLYSWGTPPLNIYLLASLYKIFGEYFAVDKIYALLCAIFQVVLMAVLWKTYFKNEPGIKKYAWLPCLFWFISPLTAWCYSNNMMENAMAVFTTAALTSFIFYLDKQKGLLWFSSAGALLIFFAFITKGPSALFLLTAPLLLFITGKENITRRKIITYSLVQAGVFLLIFAIVFSFDEPALFLKHYIQVQLSPALFQNNKFSIASFTIIYRLAIALLPIMLLAGIGFIFQNRKLFTSQMPLYKKGFAFIVIGLSASLPIVLSSKQSSFYLLPSVPFFAIGFAMLVLPTVNYLTEKINDKMAILLRIACFVVIGACVFLCPKNRGTFSRDEEILAELENVQPLIGNQKEIMASGAMWTEHSLNGYLYRVYGRRVCMPGEKCSSDIFMTKPGTPDGQIPANTTIIYSGKNLALYKITR